DPALSADLPKSPSQEEMFAAFRRVDPRAEELAEFKRLPVDGQWLDLGKRIVIDKGCNNCHTVAPDGKPFANVLASSCFEDIKRPQAQGCMAANATQRGKAPAFSWSDADRKALRRFLLEGTAGTGSPAPLYMARVTMQRFNCLACHSRNGEGGLP